MKDDRFLNIRMNKEMAQSVANALGKDKCSRDELTAAEDRALNAILLVFPDIVTIPLHYEHY